MGLQASKESENSSVVQSTARAVQGATGVAAGAVKDTAGSVKEVIGAVGSEDREAIRIQKKESWGRVEEGDTLWDLSEKYLGDATQWEALQASCSRELGTDPLLLLPGSHVTEACIARARARIAANR
jgi:nucleoid-associated protein YgaU